ncbi:MAG: NAD(+) diphosphatase [Aurantimicrobium sp.]|nr:NAD(+) diphosphatase [Aurantimicrobium sp.]
MSHEIRRRLPLARQVHDRDAVRRAEPLLLDELWSDSQTRVLVVHDNSTLESQNAVVYLSPAAATGLTRVYLGHHEGSAFVAVLTDETFTADAALAAAVSSVATAQWRDLRLMGPALGELDVGLVTQAVAMANWHRSHSFSPQRGQAAEPDQAGWVRVDDAGTQIFPRTDAAIIVLVTDDDDRVLLGNNALWEEDRFSLLAGYVEPGESLEDAVVREMAEECGLRVVNPTYVASQPWPFPASLMLGFRARVAEGQDANAITADGEEIRSLRWFTREELVTAAESDAIKLPGPVSIARHLLEDWLGASIAQEDTWLGKR